MLFMLKHVKQHNIHNVITLVFLSKTSSMQLSLILLERKKYESFVVPSTPSSNGNPEAFNDTLIRGTSGYESGDSGGSFNNEIIISDCKKSNIR